MNDLNKFDWQVLEMLCRCERDLTRTPEDLDIWNSGQKYLHAGWGGELKSGKRYEYAPLVALSLGRLVKLGLAKKERPATYSHCVWRITEAGYNIAKGLIHE